MTKKSTGEFLSFVSDVAQVVADHLATGEPTAPAAPAAAAASPATALPVVAGPTAAPSTPVAPAPLDDFFLDDEKVVWDWPDVGGRAIEELR
jgi:hypothetical protein